jgi:hypothetical protein
LDNDPAEIHLTQIRPGPSRAQADGTEWRSNVVRWTDSLDIVGPPGLKAAVRPDPGW